MRLMGREIGIYIYIYFSTCVNFVSTAIIYIYIYDSHCFHTNVDKDSDLLGYDTMSFPCRCEFLSLKFLGGSTTLKMDPH